MFTNEVSASTDASNIDGRLPSSCADSAINAPSRVGFTDGDSNSGVSTNSVMSPTRSWYILRTTYGQEQKAYDYIVDHGGTAYYPKISTFKTIKGVEKVVESSRIPNIFFAYGTFDEIKNFVYDNVHLPFLRFYYKHHHEGRIITKVPLIIPKQQLESLRIITEVENQDTLVYDEKIHKFEKGQLVRVIEGDFKGVVGRVARFQGQLRVGILIDDLMTVATAYVPKQFLEYVED